MDKLTFFLYILSRAMPTIRPEIAASVREWQERICNDEQDKFTMSEFCRELNLPQKVAAKFCSLFNKESPAKLAKKLVEANIQTVNLCEDNYPALLKEIPDPPLILYYRGNITAADSDYGLAVVGSRRATTYGELATEKLLAGVCGAPVTIISGLAYGIDSLAHRAALKNNLKTVAVLGTGLDNANIYPAANLPLAEQIIEEGGVLVSEYPPGTTAKPYQFVARNRIIAGLARATLIVEAAAKSGALITADFAMDYNRSVLAVPGSIVSKYSAGPHKLIQDGAMLLKDATDLLQEFNLQSEHATTTNVTAEEARVLKYMQHEPVVLEQLITLSALPIHKLQAILSELELKQLIKQVNPQIYLKI